MVSPISERKTSGAGSSSSVRGVLLVQVDSLLLGHLEERLQARQKAARLGEVGRGHEVTVDAQGSGVVALLDGLHNLVQALRRSWGHRIFS